MMEEVMERTAVLRPASRKPNIPVALRFIQWAFPKLESIAPRFAHAWFVKLFFSPPRYPIPASEKEVIRKADRFTVRAGEKHAECYAWGDGPVILLVHGWAGRAGQFRNFILPFVKAGYKVIAFDAPAHGLSKGSATSIIDFKDAILNIEKEAGAIQAVIGHSLGGAAGLFAISEGLGVRKMITIATPTVGDEIIQEFTSRLNGSQRAIDHLKTQLHHTFNRSFDEFMATHFIRLLPVEIDLLILHDENDKEATLKNAAALLAAYPAGRFIKTTGLGHVRILRDDKVIEACLEFVGDKKSGARSQASEARSEE